MQAAVVVADSEGNDGDDVGHDDDAHENCHDHDHVHDDGWR